jgi:hypothetical protein
MAQIGGGHQHEAEDDSSGYTHTFPCHPTASEPFVKAPAARPSDNYPKAGDPYDKIIDSQGMGHRMDTDAQAIFIGLKY